MPYRITGSLDEQIHLFELSIAEVQSAILVMKEIERHCHQFSATALLHDISSITDYEPACYHDITDITDAYYKKLMKYKNIRFNLKKIKEEVSHD